MHCFLLIFCGDTSGADPEDKDEYKDENLFFAPSEAHWTFLEAQAKQPKIGTFVDEAMDVLEKENPSAYSSESCHPIGAE
jgi:type I restriction enzyme M protein